jgi:nicotinate-nucleotide adenylyltransferase
MDVGILGGTFNPPHRGHLELARHARSELGLDAVILIPAYMAPFKTGGEDDPGPEHRLRMCELAVAGEPGLSVSPLEIERGGVSYTIDTLTELHASDPEAELTLIVGADVAGTLGSWREPSRLFELARVAVAQRPGADAQPPAIGAGRISPLQMGEVEVSSSMVRGRIARGEAVDDLVGVAVAGYISEHGLYREPVATTTGGGA